VTRNDGSRTYNPWWLPKSSLAHLDVLGRLFSKDLILILELDVLMAGLPSSSAFGGDLWREGGRIKLLVEMGRFCTLPL